TRESGMALVGQRLGIPVLSSRFIPEPWLAIDMKIPEPSLTLIPADAVHHTTLNPRAAGESFNLAPSVPATFAHSIVSSVFRHPSVQQPYPKQ
ncbi:hypothetical protein V5O48_010336, partial [Marasmius crinis-equi]